MTLLTKNSIIEVGIQATRTAPAAMLVPVRVRDIEFNPYHAVRTIERMNAIGFFGNDTAVFGGSLASVTFTWDMHPAPAAPPDNGVPPEDTLYQIASMVPTATSTEVTYGLTSDPTAMKFAHINFFMGLGRKRTIYGAVCSAMSFNFTAGDTAKVTATFVGYLDADIDGQPGQKVFNASQPYICHGAHVALGGVTNIPIKSLTIDLGLSVPDRADMANDSSYAAPTIVNRVAEATLTLEQTLKSVNDWDDDIKAGRGLSLLFQLSVPDFEFNAQHAVIKQTTDGDDEGVRTDELPLMLARNTGNDEFSMLFHRPA